MVINTYAKFKCVTDKISSQYGHKLSSFFISFYDAFQTFSDKLNGNFAHCLMMLDENVVVSDDDLAFTILCFKGNHVQEIVYPLKQVCESSNGNDSVPLYLQMCKDFDYFCNIS